VVDYLGLANQFKNSLVTYTESGGQGDPTFDTAQAVAVMLEKHATGCTASTGTSGPPANPPNASPSIEECRHCIV
jgi:type I restriction enzyme R subunit